MPGETWAVTVPSDALTMLVGTTGLWELISATLGTVTAWETGAVVAGSTTASCAFWGATGAVRTSMEANASRFAASSCATVSRAVMAVLTASARGESASSSVTSSGVRVSFAESSWPRERMRSYSSYSAASSSASTLNVSGVGFSSDMAGLLMGTSGWGSHIATAGSQLSTADQAVRLWAGPALSSAALTPPS